MSSQPLRIAHLAFSALPRSIGGLEIVVDRLLRAQLEAGCEVRLVTRWKQYRAFRNADFPYSGLPLPPNPKLRRDPFGPVGPRWPVSAVVKAYQWRYRFDLWHLHSLYPAAWMAYDALAAMQVPVVVTAHGADIETDRSNGYGFRLRPEHDRRIKELVRRAGSLTAISPSIEARYRELGALEKRISRIPNGVDVGRFRGRNTDRVSVRTSLGLPLNQRLVLTVGSNRPAKGHRFVPPALAAIRRAGRDVGWVVLGGDPASLRELARREGVEDHLHVVPAISGDLGRKTGLPCDAVIDMYKAADIFAVPSVSEGFGLVAIEAMAAGLPVVASGVGGLKDLIDDGKNGLLCTAASPPSMAAAIGRILDAPDLGHRLVVGAERTVRRYDWASINRDYLRLYRQLVEVSA